MAWRCCHCLRMTAPIDPKDYFLVGVVGGGVVDPVAVAGGITRAMVFSSVLRFQVSTMVCQPSPTCAATTLQVPANSCMPFGPGPVPDHSPYAHCTGVERKNSVRSVKLPNDRRDGAHRASVRQRSLYPARDVLVVLMHMEHAVRSIGVGATD